SALATSAWVWKSSTFVGVRPACAKARPASGIAASAALALSSARRGGLFFGVSRMAILPLGFVFWCSGPRTAYIGFGLASAGERLQDTRRRRCPYGGCDIRPQRFLSTI